MPLPIQAIYPLGIVAGALIAGGVVLDHTYRFFNNGKVRAPNGNSGGLVPAHPAPPSLPCSPVVPCWTAGTA